MSSFGSPYDSVTHGQNDNQFFGGGRSTGGSNAQLVIFPPHSTQLTINFKQLLLDEVFVISGIIKVEVCVISIAEGRG